MHAIIEKVGQYSWYSNITFCAMAFHLKTLYIIVTMKLSVVFMERVNIKMLNYLELMINLMK